MYKLDIAGPLANFGLSTTIGTIYTVPAGKIAQINSIVIVNTSTSSEDFALWLNTQDNTHLLQSRFTLPVGARRVIKTNFTLAAAATILGITYISGAYFGVYANVHGVQVIN